MMPWVAFVAAGVLAGLFSAWWYGRREEKVDGRGLAAALRAAAVFLVLASPWLPAVGRGEPRPGVAILVDHSRSMRHPVGENVDTARMQAARQAVTDLLRTRPAAATWAFGSDVARIEAGDVELLGATGGGSRLSEAIARARSDGADSLIVVTDGEIEDREAARRLAERLGVAVTEVNVAGPLRRVGILRVLSPHAVTAGDTFEIRVEIVAAGGEGDSAEVRLSFGPGVSKSSTVELPGPGRSVEASFRVEAGPVADSAEWRPLEVRVPGPDSVSEPGASARSWLAVSSEPTGAVMISLVPDWEVAHLSPVLERSVPGGARVFARMGEGAYLQVGARPRGGVREAEVRRAAEAATLLVVQGEPDDMPAWLEALTSDHPAVLHLVKGPGRIPGTDAVVQEELPGEWYAEVPPPAGPVSAHLLEVEAAGLPPLVRQWSSPDGIQGPVLWSRRDRRGPVRPVAATGSSGARRWAVVYGEGTWRWAARSAEGLSLYRALYAGMFGWLVERTAPRPVQLSDSHVRSGEPVRWRVAPEVRDLLVTVENASGAVVWSDSLPVPARQITGPALGEGEARFVAIGSVRGSPFRIDRPFHVNAGLEEMPGVTSPPLEVRPEGGDPEAAVPASDPPVWPLALAIGLLCAEWMWRRRIGLR